MMLELVELIAEVERTLLDYRGYTWLLRSHLPEVNTPPISNCKYFANITSHGGPHVVCPYYADTPYAALRGSYEQFQKYMRVHRV